jgi:hypothetical protein
MTLMPRDADFGFTLEATDAGAVPGARIDHDHRRFVRIDTIVPTFITDLCDAEQSVVDRALEVARVQDDFRLKSSSGGRPVRSCSSTLLARCRSVSQKRMRAPKDRADRPADR